jgi:hypothetical protein
MNVAVDYRGGGEGRTHLGIDSIWEAFLTNERSSLNFKRFKRTTGYDIQKVYFPSIFC